MFLSLLSKLGDDKFSYKEVIACYHSNVIFNIMLLPAMELIERKSNDQI